MKEIRYIFKYKVILFLFLIYFICVLTPAFTDGTIRCFENQCGLVNRDMRDGMWFDAISAVAFKSVPFQMPNFAGQQLGGYHYLPNLLSFLIHQTTSLPFYFIRLKILPFIYLFLVMILSVKVAKKIHDDHRFVFIFVLFLLLGGPLRIITALYNFNLSELWSNFMINTFEATNIMVSPHTAFSLVLLLLLLNSLLESKITFKYIFFNSVILLLLFGTKFYTAFAAIIIYFTYSMQICIKEKKFSHAVMIALSLFITVVLSYFAFYGARSIGKNSVFTFAPFALAHHIIENKTRFFYSNDLVLQRYFLYSNVSKFSLRLLLIELYSSFLFILFYVGIRSIGLLFIVFKIKDIIKNKLWLSLLFAIIPLTLFPLLFIQRGVWFDTAQFLVTGSFLLSIFSSEIIFRLIHRIEKKFVIITFLILLPFFIQNILILKKNFDPFNPIISHEELQALKILKSKPQGTVFYPITNGDSPYVNVFSEKQSFVNYVHVLENVGINYLKRLQIADSADVDALAKQEVSYIYIVKKYNYSETPYFSRLYFNLAKSKKYSVFFSNSKVTMYVRNK